MEAIRLITDLTDLNGTCYFEFLPGIYSGKCWNEKSVFIDDHIIGLIEPVFYRNINNYDHYSFMSADKETWLKITNELCELQNILRNSSDLEEVISNLSIAFPTLTSALEENFNSTKSELVVLINELVIWVTKTLKSNSKISILGM